MSDSKQENEEKFSQLKTQVRRNEEQIDTLRAELDRFEDQEFELAYNHNRLHQVMVESRGWNGPAANQFKAQMESELRETYVSIRKECDERYRELTDSVASLRRKNEGLREELKRREDVK